MTSTVLYAQGGRVSTSGISTYAGWDVSPFSVSATQQIVGVLGERWIQKTSTGGPALITPSFTLGGSRQEFEISMALRIDNNQWATNNQGALMRLSSQSGTALGVQLGCFTPSGLTQSRALRFVRPGGAVANFSTPFILQENTTYYIVFRGRAQSTVSATDGLFELYINGQLIHSFSEDWVTFGSTASTGSKAVFGGTSSGNFFFRNCVVRDGWSSPAGQAPKWLWVSDDAPVLSATGGWDVQGTTSGPNALNDLSNGSRLSAPSAGLIEEILWDRGVVANRVAIHHTAAGIMNPGTPTGPATQFSVVNKGQSVDSFPSPVQSGTIAPWAHGTELSLSPAKVKDISMRFVSGTEPFMRVNRLITNVTAVVDREFYKGVFRMGFLSQPCIGVI